MNDAFAILASFLDRQDAEVEGRALELPPDEVRVQFREFARGELPETQWHALAGQLSQNRHWIPILVEEVKALRGNREAPVGESAQ